MNLFVSISMTIYLTIIAQVDMTCNGFCLKLLNFFPSYYFSDRVLFCPDDALVCTRDTRCSLNNLHIELHYVPS